MASLLQTRIREKIESANLTTASLERKAKLPMGTVQKILAGNTKNPSIETVWAIARVFQCRIDYLINENETQDGDIFGEKIPFIPNLYSDCAAFVSQYFTSNNVQISLGEAFSVIKEIYTYSLDRPDASIDKRFASWILKNFNKAKN